MDIQQQLQILPGISRWIAAGRLLSSKKNLNAPKPSEHPPEKGGEDVKA